MPRISKALTIAVIRKTKAADKSVKLSDGGGMYLLLKPDGSRYWRMDYRFGGKRKTLALGVYPQISLTAARQRRATARELLGRGVDPAAALPGSKRRVSVIKPRAGVDRRNQARRASRRQMFLQTISSMNELLMTATDEHDLMQSICQALVHERLFRMAWIGMVAENSMLVHPVAQAGLVEGYLDMVDIRCDASPQGKGPTGAAIRTGKTVINTDTETDTGFAPWREVARVPGFRSSAATPIRRQQDCIGALNVYSDEAHAFGADDIMLLEKLATDLGIAIERRAAERALRESEAHARMLLDSSPEAIFGVDTQGVCTFVNRACLHMLGYMREADLVGKTLHSLIHHSHADGRPYPKEQCNIRLSTLNGESTHVDDEVHWRADGRSFPVEYWSHPMYRDGELVGAVVNFVDITERKRAERALRESEERYRLISNVANDLLYSCLRPEGGNFNMDWATMTADRIFGYSLQEIIEQGCWCHYVHPDDVPIFLRNVINLQPGQSSECELRIIAKDGSTRYLRANSTIIVESDDAQRTAHRLYGSCQDITERRQTEEALRDSEGRFRAMAEQSVDLIWAVDTQGRHTYANRNLVTILGYESEEVIDIDPSALVHPDDWTLYRETHDLAVQQGAGWSNVALRWQHRDGSYRVLESTATPLFDDAGTLIGFQGVDRDITERKVAEERIEFLAHHDVLTGLPNRILLRDRFEQALHHADRDKAHVAMLFLDLDNFKIVNDTLGHAAGDKLLQAVVARIIQCMRDTDTVSRQGGDEFILLLDDIPDIASIERVANAILEVLAEPVDIDGRTLNTSCSIGVSLYPEDGRDFDTLMQKADAAMYNAKEAGRNTYRFFSEEMNVSAHEHLLLENRLHQALANGEFSLVYQPQLDIGSGQVFGVEALLRWYSPELGHVAPDRFIRVAEDSGSIVPIGAWVLQEACRQVSAWQAAGLPALSVAVNLSALQFRRGNLVETVASALRVSGIAPQLLELELTETILLQDVEHTLTTVRQLKALGVRLSIDDFGTGYSSLSYLKRFTVDKLKIDQSFVRDISTDPDDAAIVRAIIQLANSLRLGTIAEGVETIEQLAFLQHEGCQQIQGYFFSRPLSAENLRIFMREQEKIRPQ